MIPCQTQGAERVYRLLLRPALARLRPSTEAFLERASALAVRSAHLPRFLGF